MTVGLAAIVMLFTGFTSAYVVRKGLSDDWVSMQLPGILWWNSLVLLASSFTIEMAKRNFSSVPRLRRWWLLTFFLGIAFLAGQWEAWRQLVSTGVYVHSNPSSSFFYVLTVSHAVHLAGGVLALAYLTLRLWTGRLTPVATGVMALYWHFMDGLWIYLLLLLVLWR
jgi:cytochrome c oxidase subunit 3